MGGLLVRSSGHPPVFFQFADKTFNNVTFFIFVAIYLKPKLVALSKRNYRLQSGVFNPPAQRLAVVTLIASPFGLGRLSHARQVQGHGYNHLTALVTAPT